MEMAYTAFVLSQRARAELLSKFPTKFPDVICHHVTERFGVPQGHPAPADADITVVGYAHDASLEALVVEVNGDRGRKDGKVYHITLSLDRSQGRKPVESNALIDMGGYVELDEPVVLGKVQGMTLN
jgi:hypothetical protein